MFIDPLGLHNEYLHVDGNHEKPINGMAIHLRDFVENDLFGTIDWVENEYGRYITIDVLGVKKTFNVDTEFLDPNRDRSFKMCIRDRCRDLRRAISFWQKKSRS